MEVNYLSIISPYKVNINCYKNKDLVYKKPPNVRDKIVTFKVDVDICILSDKIDRMLSMSYYRDLMGRCSRSHKKIYNILNFITDNLLVPLSNPPDDPIHITDPCRKWDDDESPIDILDYWKKNPESIIDCINALERKTKITIDKNNKKEFFGKIIKVQLPKIDIYGNCFQGILQARIAGKYIKINENEIKNKIKKINFLA